MQKMKILHISSALPPEGKGGQDKFVLQVVKHFQEKFKIIVLVKYGDLDQENYTIYTYQTKLNFKNLVLLSKKISYLIQNVDLIHFHYPTPFFPEIPVIPLFLILNLFFKKKYIVHIHLMTTFTHFLSKIIYKPFKIMQKFFFKNSKLIFTPTSLTRKNISLNYGIPLEKVICVPYGVSNSFFKVNKNNQKKDYMKIIYVGRLHKSKRVDHLINAVLNLPKTYRLDIYGDGGDFKRLYELAKASKRIKFHGFISDENKLIQAYQNADLMVLPSTSEEMPLSILEGLAAGVPVLCSNLPTIKDEYNNNVFYLKDIEHLSLRIMDILSQNNINFIERGRRFASKYSWDICFSKIYNAYLHLFNEPNKINYL